MNNQTLPLPNPKDWATIDGVAERLGVSRRTVSRMATDGVLTAYKPHQGRAYRPLVLFWVPEVDELHQARRRVKR